MGALLNTSICIITWGKTYIHTFLNQHIYAHTWRPQNVPFTAPLFPTTSSHGHFEKHSWTVLWFSVPACDCLHAPYHRNHSWNILWINKDWPFENPTVKPVFPKRNLWSWQGLASRNAYHATLTSWELFQECSPFLCSLSLTYVLHWFPGRNTYESLATEFSTMSNQFHDFFKIIDRY